MLSSVFLMGLIGPLEGDVRLFLPFPIAESSVLADLSGSSAKIVAKSALFSAPLVLALSVVPVVAVYSWARTSLPKESKE